MTILICDICGTSYSDSNDKCPICGYARAFDAGLIEDQPHAVHEKVRGGRFSKKNVRKRLKQKNDAVDEPVYAAVHEPISDIPEEPSAPAVQPPEEPAEAVAAVPVPEEFVVEPAAEVPAEEETVAAEEKAVEEVPLILPPVTVEEEKAEAPEPPADEAEEEKKQKILAVYRRDVALNLVLFFAVAVLLASAAYLAVRYVIPALQDINLPGHSMVMTDPPTDPPTDPTTEPPTDPPTEPPTDPPTDPPTEEETEPLLDVKLWLNYYDLTFPAKGDITQLHAEGIPDGDVTWISDDTSVVVISDTGLITAVGSGKTTIRAIYGDQEAVVKINCRF